MLADRVEMATDVIRTEEVRRLDAVIIFPVSIEPVHVEVTNDDNAEFVPVMVEHDTNPTLMAFPVRVDSKKVVA